MAVSDVDAPVDQQFRAAMRHFAATVTILSTANGGQRYGMTATAVTSVSMAPPALLAAVNRSSLFHTQITARGAFCVNFLSARHAHECRAFGGAVPPQSRFVEDRWANGFDGLPYFLDAEASIFCTLEQQLDYATHTIFIGRVNDVLSCATIDPLIYLNGSFVERAPADLPLPKGIFDWGCFDIGFA